MGLFLQTWKFKNNPRNSLKPRTVAKNHNLNRNCRPLRFSYTSHMRLLIQFALLSRCPQNHGVRGGILAGAASNAINSSSIRRIYHAPGEATEIWAVQRRMKIFDEKY